MLWDRRRSRCDPGDCTGTISVAHLLINAPFGLHCTLTAQPCMFVRLRVRDYVMYVELAQSHGSALAHHRTILDW